MGTVPGGMVLERKRDASSAVADEARGGRSDPAVHFYLTGFGKFHQVDANPTERLMNGLPAFLRDTPLEPRCVLASTQVLKVAAETSRAELVSLYARLADARACVRSSVSPAPLQVVIHFGVNVGVTRFALELQARNEATFLCPDELGWAPIMQRIDKSEEKITAVKHTSLPLDDLVKDLRDKGFPADISTDAGRFVCNWVYYNSLVRALKSGVHSLFVHVPPESIVSLPDQLRFSRQLIQSISHLISQ